MYGRRGLPPPVFSTPIFLLIFLPAFLIFQLTDFPTPQFPLFLTSRLPNFPTSCRLLHLPSYLPSHLHTFLSSCLPIFLSTSFLPIFLHTSTTHCPIQPLTCSGHVTAWLWQCRTQSLGVLESFFIMVVVVLLNPQSTPYATYEHVRLSRFLSQITFLLRTFSSYVGRCPFFTYL